MKDILLPQDTVVCGGLVGEPLWSRASLLDPQEEDVSAKIPDPVMKEKELGRIFLLYRFLKQAAGTLESLFRLFLRKQRVVWEPDFCVRSPPSASFTH